MDKRKQKFKIWRATLNSTAGFQCTPTTVVMAGNPKNAIVADENGVYLSMGGSVSFGTTSENIRMGGLFVQMNDFIRMIPQSMMTPFPNCIPFPPVALFLSSARDLVITLAALSPI